MARRGSGPLLQRRFEEAKKAPKKSCTIPGGFDRKAIVADVIFVAAAFFGVELADMFNRHASGVESSIVGAIWAPSRPCTAKVIVFPLLLPGHRVAQSVAEAIWEQTQS